MLAHLLLILSFSIVPWQEREVVRQSEAHFARGIELQQKGDLPAARDAYEAALKLIPRRVDALTNLGVVYAKLGQYDLAIKNYRAALETERAYDNPKFVEDMVRDVATQLNNEKRIDKYIVESENFESIHNHSAYALIENDKRKR